jgi:hypothetical protein
VGFLDTPASDKAHDRTFDLVRVLPRGHLTTSALSTVPIGGVTGSAIGEITYSGEAVSSEGASSPGVSWIPLVVLDAG